MRRSLVLLLLMVAACSGKKQAGPSEQGVPPVGDGGAPFLETGGAGLTGSGGALSIVSGGAASIVSGGAVSIGNGGMAGNGGQPAGGVKILFVGNSYTFARVAPALQYNAANVKDLTAAFNALDPTGTLSFPVGSGIPPSPCATAGTPCFEPHDFGGVPGIFKKLTEEAGLHYDVSLSTRNAATLRAHFLNTANATWDLLGNVAKEKWDVVVLQGQSDEALPSTKSKNGNLVSFAAFVDQLERYVHVGTGGTLTETEIFGSLAACSAAKTATPPGAGFSAASCGASHVIAPNPNANPNALVYVFQTWARPDMVAAHKCTRSDDKTTDGAPILNADCSCGTEGNALTGESTLYYTAQASPAANLRDMTTDLHAAYYGKVMSNPKLTGVVPVGDAFQSAVDTQVVKIDNFYLQDGTFDDSGLLDLWWKDRTHESKFGAYLAGLMMYGTLTGRDPATFGPSDAAFGELGIAEVDALALQKVAHDTLSRAGTLPPK